MRERTHEGETVRGREHEVWSARGRERGERARGREHMGERTMEREQGERERGREREHICYIIVSYLNRYFLEMLMELTIC